MTREEAIKYAESKKAMLEAFIFRDDCAYGDYAMYSTELSFVNAVLTALRHQMWEEQLWHDAKTDPPKTPGLYYGKTDDTNSMYACQYRDGVWVLDMYPQQKMEIVQWADYTAFVQDNVESALRPVSLEQVEKMKKEPVEGEYDELYAPTYKCPECGFENIGGGNFCRNCGCLHTDEAVEMVMERMEELKDATD
jgi:hypothetical protein